MSTLTHIPEANVRLWLDEIHRVLAPGGLLIATTHGHTALQRARESEIHRQVLHTTEGEAADMADRLSAERFIFTRYPPAEVELASAGDEYGITYIHQTYFEDFSTQGKFTLVEYLPGALHSWQDIVVLRREA